MIVGDGHLLRRLDPTAEQVRLIPAPAIDFAVHDQDALRLPKLLRLLPDAREDDDVTGAMHILQGHEGHLVALFRHVAMHTLHHSHDGGLLPVHRAFGQRSRVAGHHVVQAVHDPRQGVLGDVDADQVLLPGQTLLFRHLRQLSVGGEQRLLGLHMHARRFAEKAHLADILRLMHAGAQPDDAVGDGEQLCAGAKAAQRPHLDQTLQSTPIDLPQIHALAEIVQIFE